MEEEKENKIGVGYPSFQLAKALVNNQSPNLQNSKTKKWLKVIKGMFDGTLSIGSRTPVKSLPTWVTLEVVKGGFATSNLLAGGDLQGHELELLSELNLPRSPKSRENLNLYFVTEGGIEHLSRLLETGAYNINVPEEGALLSVAILLNKGNTLGAREILSDITPYFDRLRFFPQEKKSLVEEVDNESVFVQSAGEVLENINCNKQNQNIFNQKNSVLIWTPFYDRLVSLFIQSFYPSIDPTIDFNLQNAKPLRAIDKEWLLEKDKLLAEYNVLREQHRISNRWVKPGAQFSKLIHILTNYSDSKDYIDSNEKYLTQAIERYISKHGYPESEAHINKREKQKKQCDAPDHIFIKQTLIKRLNKLNNFYGIEDVNEITKKISMDEATNNLPANSLIPDYLQTKVNKAKVGQINTLIETGIIRSSDILAKLMPQITANVICSSFNDLALKILYKKIYISFRLRRSLLLLNYLSQVKINEIPWVKQLNQYKKYNLSAIRNAENVLKETFNLAITHFPFKILPNKLLQEFRSLLAQNKKQLPLTDEVAADIFMGGFSPKFAEAAYMAALELEDSLYARYFNIDYQELKKRCSPVKGKFDKSHAKEFSSICNNRAQSKKKFMSVAENGMVIEQQQILTTHNLAQLFQFLDLNNDEIVDLVLMCFKWISKRFKPHSVDHRANLIMVKNIAYAWRQMIFLLSKLESREQLKAVAVINQQFSIQPHTFRRKFSNVIKTVVELIDNPNKVNRDYTLTGWTIDKHYLIQ